MAKTFWKKRQLSASFLKSLLTILYLATTSVLEVAAAKVPLYELTYLGDLPGGSETSSARGINNAGEVVGVGYVEPGTNGGARHAFLWTKNEGMIDLGTLIGPDYESFAWDINSRGQVTGWSVCPPDLFLGNPCGFIWDPRSSEMSLLGDVSGVGPIREAYAINEGGDLVGWAGGGRGIRAIFMDGRGNIVNLGSNVVSSAWGLNERGEVVGEEDGQAVYWDTNTGDRIDISELVPGSRSRAWDINESGQVVFDSVIAGTYQSFLWSKQNGLFDLGALESGSETRVIALNNRGMVVGNSAGRAFIWTSKTGIVDLNTMIDPSDPLFGNLRLIRAWDINERGQIVCDGEFIGTAGVPHAILLTPVAR